MVVMRLTLPPWNGLDCSRGADGVEAEAEEEGIGVTEWMNSAFGSQTMDAGMFQQTMFSDPTVDLSIAIQATLTLIIAGTLAGFFPAKKAVSISPIEALRAD